MCFYSLSLSVYLQEEHFNPLIWFENVISSYSSPLLLLIWGLDILMVLLLLLVSHTCSHLKSIVCSILTSGRQVMKSVISIKQNKIIMMHDDVTYVDHASHLGHISNQWVGAVLDHGTRNLDWKYKIFLALSSQLCQLIDWVSMVSLDGVHCALSLIEFPAQAAALPI